MIGGDHTCNPSCQCQGEPDVAGRDLSAQWFVKIRPSSHPDPEVKVLDEKAGHPEYYVILDELEDLHALKSGGYGTGQDPFANFTAVSAVSGRARYEYPIERMIEKLTRAQSLIAQGRIDELGEEFGDIAGLAVCAEVMRREDTGVIASRGDDS